MNKFNTEHKNHSAESMHLLENESNTYFCSECSNKEDDDREKRISYNLGYADGLSEASESLRRTLDIINNRTHCEFCGTKLREVKSSQDLDGNRGELSLVCPRCD